MFEGRAEAVVEWGGKKFDPQVKNTLRIFYDCDHGGIFCGAKVRKR
jgi:hypothetical protein